MPRFGQVEDKIKAASIYTFHLSATLLAKISAVLLVLRGSTMKNWRRSIKSAKRGAIQQQETDLKEGSQRIRDIPVDGNGVVNKSTSSEGIEIICLENLADVNHPEEIPDEAKYQMPFENNIIQG